MQNNLGKFIVFEGLDLSGKSTQLELIKKYFEDSNIKYISTREPGGTKFSEEIRPIILNTEIDPLTELLLYEATRREHVVRKILPALKEGIHVISDRFYDSSTAYQAYGRGLSVDTVENLNKMVTKCDDLQVKADLNIFIDIPIHIMKERLVKRKNLDKFEKNLDEMFFTRVRNGFLEIAKKSPYKIIDGTKSIEDIHQEVLNTVKELIK